MILKIKLLLFSLFIVTNIHSQTKKTTLRILQFNFWQKGTVVPGGFPAIIEEVIRSKADLIALSEVRNYQNNNFAKKLIEALEQKGYTYYSIRSKDTGILSRYPILYQEAIFPVENDQGSVTKAIISIKGTEIAFYSAHLDYRKCNLYLPRGYDGSTWKKLDTSGH